MTPPPDVRLEELAPAHIGAVAEWLSAPETNVWLTTDWRGRKVDPVVVGLAARNKKNRFYLTFADERPCGLVALADIDMTDKVAMVWYILGDKQVAGRGVTTAALQRLVRIAFEEFGLECLYAWIIDDNTPSRRVLEKAGFREAGLLRSAVSRGERRLGRQYFDLIRTDLPQRRSPTSNADSCD